MSEQEQAAAAAVEPISPEQVADALPPADVDPAKDVPSPAQADESALLVSPAVYQAIEDSAAAAPNAEHPAHTLLNDLEAIALYWGGDLGNKMRDMVCKIRNLI